MSADQGDHWPIPATVRPLPPRPSIEFERKRAKTLLRKRRTADPHLKLSDVQFGIAREYGFTSWPRLVEYFRTWERHEVTGPRAPQFTRETAPAWVDSMMREHAAGHSVLTGLATTFVPRHYARAQEEARAAGITRDEAELIMARSDRFPDWPTFFEALPERHEPELPREEHGRLATTQVMRAASRGDLASVQRLVCQHPAWLTEGVAPSGSESLRRIQLAESAWGGLAEGLTTSHGVIDWLRDMGQNVQTELNRMLLGRIAMPRKRVQALLDLGADPDWLPPNGIPILEHALVRWHNGSAVDVLAGRVTPRRALWIGAALGDTREVARWFDRGGALRPEAFERRPDFTAVHRVAPSHPGQDARHLLWEALLVAIFNQRTGSVDALARRGADVDYSPWESTLLLMVVANSDVAMTRCLLEHGADPDRRGWRPALTPREYAEMNLQEHPDREGVAEIHALMEAIPKRGQRTGS